MKSIKTAIFLVNLLYLSVANSQQITAVPSLGAPSSTGLDRAASVAKAGFRLNRVFREYSRHIATRAAKDFKPSDHFLQFTQGRVLIDARAMDDGVVLLADLQKIGLQKGKRYGALVSGLLPVAAIKKAAVLDSLRSIHATLQPVRNAGSITSQGDKAIRSDIARSTYALDGSGVTVGVMSDSYNMLGGAADDITSGDLPAGVMVVGGESSACGTLIYCIDEGRAMLQIVHDIAPGANLQFHTALSSMVDFANGILTLEAAGADVIVDDLLYLNEPMFEDGIVAQAVDAVTANGVAYYSAAGNQGRKSYETAFRDSGMILCIEIFQPYGDCHPLYERVGRLHDFDPGSAQKLFQSVTIPFNTTLTIALQWDESFGNARIDHDIVLLDATGSVWYEFGANDNIATGEGWEVLQFTNYDFLTSTTEFSMAITYDDVDSIDAPATLLKTVVFGSSVINDFPTNSSTLIGHANAAGAAAVGAAFYLDTPEYGTAPPLLELYSSAGGTPILFAANGSRLATPEVRLKPEFTAVDGVNTTFFFDDSYGNDGIDDFFGTSAAAPHAAGAAALMLQTDPSLTPAQIKSVFGNTAIDMLSAGFDQDSGYGLIQVDAAIAALTPSANNPPVASFSVNSITDLSVEFMDTSNDADGNETITTWEWNFGGDGVSTAQHPTHTFSASGTYDVVLTVTDDQGAKDTTLQSITVGDGEPEPIVVATPTNLAATVAGSTVTLTWTDTSDNEDGFRISRAKKTKGKYVYDSYIAIAPANSNEYIDEVPEIGDYRYKIQAYSSLAESDFSNEVAVKIDTLLPPDTGTLAAPVLSASISGLSVTLTWAHECSEAPCIYNIERGDTKVRGQINFAALAYTTGLSFTDTLSSAGAYYYKVYATTGSVASGDLVVSDDSNTVTVRVR